MSEFDKIIGYNTVKEELKQLSDMIHNFEIYEKLGAKMPKGLLIYGVPGVGKSLMARSFVKESRRKPYIIRRNRPNGDFVNEIKKVFTDAAKNTPSIILLDDMDKFAVEEDSREEFVALQACIDEVAFSDVYVIATANDLYDIPDSLLRAGRFDRKIYIDTPQGDDAIKIIRHYLASKAVVGGINIDDIAKMLHRKSCAVLETVLNEAAIYAGFERSEKISMDHIVQSILRNEYGVSDSFLTIDTQHFEKIAYHEAGHVVIGEILNPNSTGIASLGNLGSGNRSGFVITCSELKERSHIILTLLAGKVATELKFGIIDEGSKSDLEKAIRKVKLSVIENGSCGVGVLDIFENYEKPSDSLRVKQESIIHAEIERYLLQAKEMLIKNSEFLDTIASALLEKGVLLNSDIQKYACTPIM